MQVCRAFSAFLAAAVVMCGCATSLKSPDLGGLYTEAAMNHGPEINPVIVIPGILGSRLKDPESGKIVWGAFNRDGVNPSRSQGARLVALPMQQGARLAELIDGVVPDGALDKVRLNLIGLPVELGAYVKILETLGAGGYRDEQLATSGAINYGDGHFTCFQFSYDWRRSCAENAAALGRFIDVQRAYIKKEYAKRYGIRNARIKFDIVAHSMGGLVARYYLRYGSQPLPVDGSLPPLTWAGARNVENAVLVGTPNAGAIDALKKLTNGFGIPLLATYPKTVLGTMPAIYELLPRTRHRALVDEATGETLDILDPTLWIEKNWGLADPGQDRILEILLPDLNAAQRRAVALDHLEKCLANAGQLLAALDQPAKPPTGTRLHLFAGDAVSTPERVSVDVQGKLAIVQTAPGDGTVLRTSALLDERAGATARSGRLTTPVQWGDVNFLFTNHLATTDDPHFTDNLLYLLMESPQ